MKHSKVVFYFICLLIYSCGQFNEQVGEAIQCVHEGDFQRALTIYGELIARKNDDPLILNNYGWTLFKADSLEKAKMILMRAENLASSDQLKHIVQINLSMVRTFLIGKKLLENNNAEDALSYFQQVTDTFHVKEIGCQYLGFCYENLGNRDVARKNWEEIVEIYDNSSVRNAFYWRARKTLRAYALKEIEDGNYEEAIRIYRIIANAEKDSATSLNALGWALFRNDKLKDAKKILEKARALDNSKSVQDSVETNLFMVATFLAGEYSLRKKNYESALKEFEKVTHRYPENDVGLQYLALSYEGLGDKKKADELWQRIAYLNEGRKYKNQYYQMAIQKLKLELE